MRLIRPLFVVRVASLLLGLSVGLPSVVDAQTRKPATRTQQKTSTPAKKPAAKKPASTTYSAQSAQARKARLARARAAAKEREAARVRAAAAALRETMTPRYRTDENGLLVPDLRAAAAIAFNPETGEVLWQENAQAKRPIASITKVMTALVFLEDNPDLSREVTIQSSDVYAASVTYIRAHERVSLNNLLNLTLIASDNGAARALARVSHGGTASFVERMNEKAIELGLESTTFADPSGLNPANVSNAYDLSRLISYASADERIASIMRTPQYTATIGRRTVTINNTNKLLAGSGVDVMGGKTGFISKAGYCLATLLRIPQTNQTVAVVVLGAQSNPARFWETRHLFNWLSAQATTLFGKDQIQ
ncbi:MAG TPA: serine hydrolase [Vicinamibacterales bacterium]|nr:serine hydrolase [Vicinamibacterales bacterium]